MKDIPHSHESGETAHAHTHGGAQESHSHESVETEAHSHAHTHTHTHTQTKSVLNRLARAIGHLNSVKGMVEQGRDCSEVLIQLSAVRSALNSISEVILKDHLDHCIVDAVQTGDMEAIDELKRAIELMLK